ncbi:MarC family protein [Acidocella sp.]|uniref:MarC family protein n=1 Tax=Acidocella sp. TaxID=50710 RepID=UPI00260A4563|nr:MarC family protein [Acidocella sp.]
MIAQALSAFLLAFPALFSIINPLGGAIIFNEITSGQSPEQKASLARRVALFSFLVMFFALVAGTYILNFFGISMNALRIAGGLVVAVRAYEMLNAPDSSTQRKQRAAAPVNAAPEQDLAGYAFFPLTMPFTAGPGTIAVAISLATARPDAFPGAWVFYAGETLAVLANAAIILVCYSASDRMVGALGHSGQAVVSRMVAFLLLGIGVQIALNGVVPVLHEALGR